jgi:integrase
VTSSRSTARSSCSSTPMRRERRATPRSRRSARPTSSDSGRRRSCAPTNRGRSAPRSRRQHQPTLRSDRRRNGHSGAVARSAQRALGSPRALRRPGRATLATETAFDRWLESAAPTLRPATARRYRDVARLHIVGKIGHVRLAKLTPSDVQRLYADRLTAGLSPTSVHHIHAILHRALNQAVRWGLLMRNVTDAVDPPRRSSPEMRTWDTRQVAAVLAKAADDDLEALWRLALLAGMRRGELLGLRWGDLDLDAGTLSVRRTLSRGSSSRLEIGEPKTGAGKRRVSLPASAVESLRQHRKRQLKQRLAAGPAYVDQDLVFAKVDGGNIHPNTLSRRFGQLIERAGVPPIRFHDLRHTCATMLLAEEVHPKVVQERLGHATIAETLDRYSHVAEDMQRHAADRLDAAIDAAIGKAGSGEQTA